MIKVMGQMTLTKEEKMRLARRFNQSAALSPQKPRISLLPSARHTPLEVILNKGKGPLG